MNSTKELKTAAKAQKKAQKTNKKQQKLQQQQQQQQQQQNHLSPQQQTHTQSGDNVTMKHGKMANNAHPASAQTAYGVNKLTGKTSRMSPNQNTSTHMNTNTTTNTNNNNNIVQNNNNLNHKLNEPNVMMSGRSILPGYENAPKFERSNSFSLKGKLSKLIHSITGSKENLTKIDDGSATPYKFTRSRSMILLRRSNRRSLIEPQLEQLSEEAEKGGDPHSPRKNSLETLDKTSDDGKLTLSKSTIEFKTPRRPNAQPLTSTPLDEEVENEGQLRRKGSTLSLALDDRDNMSYDPQLNFQKRRSNTMIGSFKSTFAGLTGEKRKEKLNPKWRASLQSLQAIDNMVSYENMSFIDYDKLNGYEKDLERRLSTMNLNMEHHASQLSIAAGCEDAMGYAQNLMPLTNETATSRHSSQMNLTPQTPQTVVRRRKTSTRSAYEMSNRNSGTNNFDSDYEHNLDEPRNVYRDSLDSRKLERLNDISRNLFILENHKLVDVLNLEVSFDKLHSLRKARIRYTSASTAAGADVIDAIGPMQLKSKSLTHLDGLDAQGKSQHSVTASKTTAVSSSEYFSVSFCTEQGYPDEEFIPATKGVTLSNALSQALRRRNLTFSQITINDNNPPTGYLDTGSTSLAGSLDQNTDVENLAGHHLIITERDGSRKTLQKAASFGSRARPPRLLSSASTEETSESAQPGKQLKQRWSLFGVKNPQQSQLCELLNSYAKNGVPQRTAALNFDHPDLDAALEYLDNMHKSWRDFVECADMTDSEVRIQTAIWELVTTEVYYIHALQTVTDLFLACLEAVQDERLLTDVDQHRLFANVRDICEANLKFWTLYIYPMVAHSVIKCEPLRIGFFHQGFVAFASIFAPYKKYCAEQSTCQFYCKELNRNNPLFTSYLAWCESQKMCNRLRLADILVRPMQRLTKYSLLLAAIKKHMSDVEDIEAIDTMIHTVENFVCSVNNHLTTRQESERLKGVMARIESYDVVDTNNEQLDKMIKQYSQMFDLCAPMKGCPVNQVRHLFMEGDHKYKDNLGKADVHCFVLTDMLLVCKTMAKRGLGALKVIRQPYLTDRLVVQQTNNILNCVYLNEFQVAVTAFTLQCSEAKNWYESLKRAKMIYTRLKQTSNNWDSFRFGGSGASGGTGDSLGVKKSPINSSICSHVSSANNSHSGSVEWNDSRNISVEFEKTNSMSSDEGSMGVMGVHGLPLKSKNPTSPHKLRVATSSANMLSVQPLNHLGQSLPNLNLHHSHTNLYHCYSNNTLLVPGTTTSHSGNLLLSPSHRGISYPPPSPTRVPLRRGMAFSTSTKNPPLVKTRNITSQNSINWHQIPATPLPTPPSPQFQQLGPVLTAGGATSASASASTTETLAPAAAPSPAPTVPLNSEQLPMVEQQQQQQQQQLPTMHLPDEETLSSGTMALDCQVQISNETDV